MVGNLVRTLIRETTTWLRFYDSSGNLVLLPEEAAEAELNKNASRLNRNANGLSLAARLRELGEEPDTL